MGFFDFFKSGSNRPSIDLTDFKFVSDDHTRIQNGQKSNANNKGAWRGIRVQTSDNKTFTSTIYNLVGTHPIWGDNIQMAPKQMKIIEENSDKIFLRGFGTDSMGASFADYGITLHKQNGTIDKVTLHMFDRNTEIVYSKGNPSEMNKPKDVPKVSETPKPAVEQNLDSTIVALMNYKQKWETETSMQQKMMIAMQSDNLNNQGCDSYENGNTDLAINYFNQALQIMPINDDALLNLTRSYNRKGKYLEAVEPLRKLYHLSPNSTNKNKAIAYSLLLHLIDDFDSDGGAVNPSNLIAFIKSKFGFTTTDNEIKGIIRRLNEPYNRDIIVYFLGGGFGIGLGSGDSPYMTSDGTELSTIREEIRDVLNWY